MSARLVALTPGLAPTIPVQRPVLLVGRHPECDVRIDSPQVSRRHCCLALAYDRLTIRDLGSRNGVRVNGQIVDEARLKPGDEVAIGQFLYRLDRLDIVEPPARNNARPTPITPSESPLPPLIDLDEDFIPLDD